MKKLISKIIYEKDDQTDDTTPLKGTSVLHIKGPIDVATDDVLSACIVFVVFTSRLQARSRVIIFSPIKKMKEIVR